MFQQGCYKGFSSMVLRDAPGNTVFFGSYELSKQVGTRPHHPSRARLFCFLCSVDRLSVFFVESLCVVFACVVLVFWL